MVTEINAGALTVRGRSLGGMYTGLHIPELSALLDVGTALRTGAAANHLFLSHAHVDHVGALPSLLGLRGLMGVTAPLKIYFPAVIEAELLSALNSFSAMHHWPFDVVLNPMKPGDELVLKKTLSVRAFKTLHPVPSLGYLFFRRVQKLKDEFKALPGPEIARRRKAGDPLFYAHETLELAYATDTLPEVLDRNPWLFEVQTLIMECTFLDERKSVANARAGCHIHLDQLLDYLPKFSNKNIVLMHFSQLYTPREVERILQTRCSTSFMARCQALVPQENQWWD